MTLYLHPNQDSSLAGAYTSAFKNASEIFVLSAYLRDWPDFEISDNCKNATLVVGKDFGITRKIALTEALAWKQKCGNICHFFVADQIVGFHPKIVMWKEQNQYYIIIGSSNLTIAAFKSNYEANIRIKIDGKRYQEVSNWIADILAQSKPVTLKWIEAYQEAPIASRLNKDSSTPPSPAAPNNLRLPKFPGLAKAIAERKERIYAFDDIRDELEQMVRDCASEKITQVQAYEWLIRNWNGADWKFQGNGIFRHKQSASDWRMLCAALVRCLDSPVKERDNIVKIVYDELEGSKKVEVRKAFLTEMLCHFFPDKYPLWNKPVEIWLKEVKATDKRPRGLTAGEKYIWLTKQLRRAVKINPDYPARNLAELDHVIWAYCVFKKWVKV